MSEWAPFAIMRPGPTWKVGYSFRGESGPKRGDVKHSAEGDWPGLYAVLDGPAASSWHFTVGYDRVEQHYPVGDYCYHAGDVDGDGAVAANIDLVGIEHLGSAGEPLTTYQVEMTIQVSLWCAEQYGIARFARYPEQEGVWTLVEHNQVSDMPTACPSGRIPWGEIIGRLTEEDAMTTEERAEFEALKARVTELEQYRDAVAPMIDQGATAYTVLVAQRDLLDTALPGD